MNTLLMKRFHTLLVVFCVFALIGSNELKAQTRGVGGGALLLDDNHSHIVTLTAPIDPSPEWTAWSLTEPAFKPLQWSVPVPPSNNAQAGFIYSGPLAGTTVPQLAYWLPPGQPSWSGDGNSGGYAGAWDYAGEGQLNIISGHTTTPSYLPIWSSDTGLGTSSVKDDGTTVSTTEMVSFTGGMAVTGTTTINTTGSAPTTIGNGSSTTTINGPTNINTTGTNTTAIGDPSNDVTINGSSVDIEDASTGSLMLNASATGKVTLGNANSPIFIPQGEFNKGTFDDTGTINVHSGASGTSLDNSTNFINFVDGSGSNRGSIKGQSNVDLLESPTYDAYISATLIYTVQVIIYYAGAASSTVAVADLFEAPVAIINALIYASQIPTDVVSAVEYAAIVAAESIEAGVQYTSSGADYAEYLRRADASELLSPGDVVGVKNGMISKNTEGAQSIYSVSTAPIVLGNEPPSGEATNYNEVGFLGQVPVKVHGAVHPGDFIVTSGLNDGFGVAIPEDKITPQQFTQVVGRAWTSAVGGDVGLVNVAIGLSAKDMSEIVSRQEAEIAAVKSESETQIASMNSRFQVLEQAMTESDPAKKQALLAQAQQPPVQSIAQPQAQSHMSVPVAQPLAQSIVSKPAVSSTKSALKTSPLATSKSLTDYAKCFAVTPAEMKAMGNLQHLQSYDQAMQAMKNNIRKILSTSGTRQAKSDQIKNFLLHPITDPDTRAAIQTCAMETIQSAKTMMNNPVNQTR
jgi:hypothetical protein